MDITAARQTGLRFDPSLSSFNKLLDFYLRNNGTKEGKRLVAQGPLSPPELIYAAGAIPCDLGTRSSLNAIFEGRTEIGQDAIDAQMSPEFSPSNLGMLGSVISGRCNLDIDLVVAALGGFDEQQAKSFQLIAEICKRPIHFWEVPGYAVEAEARAIGYLKKELKLLFRWLAGHTGQRVTDESLKNAIICGNAARSNMAALDACMASEMVPLKPLEYFLVQAMLGDCAGDPKTFNLLLSNLLDELNIRIERSAAVQIFPPTRIYLIGDETQELGIYNAIEDHGAAVVGCNSRLPLYYCPVDENAEPLSALAQWIWRMPNNLPVKSRIELEITAIKRQQPDAIIINSNVGSRCSPGLERLYRDVLKQQLGIPVLCIETSFPGENLDKVDYQVSALVQTITAGY